MRETKIVQVYPSDYAIEQAIKEWESFGWEMTDNQHFSDKQDLWSPVGTTVRTTSYNKLTFSREKNSSWYSAVKPLEEQYEAVQREISAVTSQKPVKKALGYHALDWVTLILPIPFFSFIVWQIIKSVSYKKKLKRYESESKAKLNELDDKATDIMRAARKIIDAA
ncbi:MAG: hypothetical protein NC311_12115 [Muribaculaceae bacterium]|nr:hypothetical protein [Muribaculaceae bacterium]